MYLSTRRFYAPARKIIFITKINNEFLESTFNQELSTLNDGKDYEKKCNQGYGNVFLWAGGSKAIRILFLESLYARNPISDSVARNTYIKKGSLSSPMITPMLAI